ncbi:MAG: hypothetical protein AB7I24_13795 [Candidatus Nanopelagicales bacterium]
MLLEGPDIRALLEQVQEQYGPQARIVHAEKVRSGGVGGFFAKQRFEVTVEVDEDAVAGTAIAAQADDVAALVESFGEGPEAAAPSVPVRPTIPARPTAPSTGARIEPLAPVGGSAPVAAVGSVVRGEAAAAAALLPVDQLLAVADRADTAADRGAPSRRSPSLVPAALTDPVVPGETPVLEEASRASGVTPFPLTRVGRDAAVANDEPTPLSDLVGWLQVQQDALAEAAAVRAAEQAPPQAPSSPRVDPATLAGIVARAGLASLAETASSPALEPTVHQSPAAPGDTPLAEEAAAAVAPRPAASEPAAPMASAPMATAPMANVTALPGVDVSVPAPRPPRRAGEVLVILGDAASAWDTATTMAASLRIPRSRVRLVSYDAGVVGVDDVEIARDVPSARLVGAQLGMERTPGIVVVDTPLSLVADPAGCDWTADVVEAIAPTAVWAVVDATRRSEDLVRWLAVLPQLEALAVHSAALTSDPGSIHRLGVPVAMIDGRPAGTIPAAPAAAAPSNAAAADRRRTS